MTSMHAALNSIGKDHAEHVLNNHSHDINRVEAAIDDTLQNLGVGYLDLYHMHWPVRTKSVL
jgi:diketogulonate reductase-like aldo/keto reductase